MTKTMRLISLATCLALSLYSGSTQAGEVCGSDAKAEFFHLQQVGKFQSFKSLDEYVEVEGTDFVGFYLAYDDARSCLFGFHNTVKGPGLDKVQTSFVCFPTDAFTLIIHDQGCGKEDPQCKVHHIGGIAIGVGNLFPVEDFDLGIEVNSSGRVLGAGPFKGNFPKSVDIGFPVRKSPILPEEGRIWVP